MSGCPPCNPCPPMPPPPCPQICPPPPPAAPCRVKPIMRGLHWTQTKGKIAQAFILAAIGGASYWYFVGYKRKQVYADFYTKTEFEDWADDMARKGLFQSVPKAGLKDSQHMG